MRFLLAAVHNINKVAYQYFAVLVTQNYVYSRLLQFGLQISKAARLQLHNSVRCNILYCALDKCRRTAKLKNKCEKQKVIIGPAEVRDPASRNSTLSREACYTPRLCKVMGT